MDCVKCRENALVTAALMEAGVELQVQNLRRRNPDASDEEIGQLLNAWLHREDDAIPGDVGGQVRVRERKS